MGLNDFFKNIITCGSIGLGAGFFARATGRPNQEIERIKNPLLFVAALIYCIKNDDTSVSKVLPFVMGLIIGDFMAEQYKSPLSDFPVPRR